MTKSSHHLTDHDIQQIVQNEINLCTQHSTLSDKKHLDITLTKVKDERSHSREIIQDQDDNNNNNNGIKYTLSKIDFGGEDEQRKVTRMVREDPRLRVKHHEFYRQVSCH